MVSILVVDDEEHIRRLIQVTLERAGHAVRLAGDGASALRECRREAPDLMVLDLFMPGMSGFEVVERLRGAPLAKEVPIVLLHVKSAERQPQLESWLEEANLPAVLLDQVAVAAKLVFPSGLVGRVHGCVIPSEPWTVPALRGSYWGRGPSRAPTPPATRRSPAWERLHVPMVYIVYTRARVWVIDYQRVQGDTIRSGVIPHPADPVVFESVLTWLRSAPGDLPGEAIEPWFMRW